jgi:hypothetical protein
MHYCSVPQSRRAGRKRRLTAAERGHILALASATPPGKLLPRRAGPLVARDEAGDAHWTLAALVVAAAERGLALKRRPIRRRCRAAGTRWRRTRSWAERRDPDFSPPGPPAAPATRTRRPG